MSERCSNANCFAHDGETCHLGEKDHTRCGSWASSDTDKTPSETAESPIASRVTWSGSALGLADLANLTPRGRTILIGVLGAQDAGKTTLLTGNYLQLLRGSLLMNAQFAGSRTLGAWESLAAWTRFDDAARMPSFPPHTPRGTSRVPGLLHIALRNAQDEFRDVLLTDAPGEWFSQWAINENATDAEGAQWLVQQADAFLVFADCQRLVADNPKRGTARNELRQLLERLGNHANQRPTTLIWAKADREPQQDIKAAIQKTLNQRLPHAQEVEASTNRPDSLLKALETVLSQMWTPAYAQPVIEPVISHQLFAAFRGHHAYA